MNFEVPPSQKDQTLPMILVMRGDEPIVDDFTYDADQAMEFLGIKRSRLTQISGRELRVGRIRRDRYIRPVYREADLRDYVEWTRATATHVSSSKAIEQAVESLDDRFNDVLVVLQERLRLQSDEDRAWVSGELLKLSRGLQQKMDRLQTAELPPSADEDTNRRRLIDKMQATLDSVKSQADYMGRLELKLDLFLPEIRELHAAQKILRRDIDELAQVFAKIGDKWVDETHKLRDESRMHAEIVVSTINEIKAEIPQRTIPRRKPSVARSYWMA